MGIEFTMVAAVLVGTLSSARLTRLLTADLFPPIVWFRIKWDFWMEDHQKNDWKKLFHCHWCMSFWTTLPVVVWGWLSNLHISWWVVNLILAISYLSAMIVERDEIPSED